MIATFRSGSVGRAVLVAAGGLLVLGVGCQRGSTGQWEFKRWDKPGQQQGEPWTILCLDTTGPEGRRALEVLAGALKNTQGLDPERVRVVQDRDTSRLYYGTYYRRRDADTGEWRMPPELRRDMGYVRRLAAGQSYPFLLCSPVPQDTAPVGPPEWDLRRAAGEYTLLVAVYSEMEGRREAAVEHVKLLRGQGEQAYYHHKVGKSHVCVGSFPASALKDTRRGVPRIDHPDFVAAKRRHPYFIYNGQYISNVNRDAAGQLISRSRQPTRLVQIPRDQGQGLQ